MGKTSNEVKHRYNSKTYRQYAIKLRYDTDHDLIDRIEELKEQGIQTTEAIKQLIKTE